MIGLAWGIFAGVVVGAIFLSYLVAKYYQDHLERAALPTMVTTLCFAVSLLSVAIVPIDIYTVSSSVDDNGMPTVSTDTLHSHRQAIEIVYYSLYAVIILLCFLGVPFAYFYFEEGDDRTTRGAQVWAGCEYTIFMLVFLIILLVVGLVLKGKPPATGESYRAYVESVVDAENKGQQAIGFVAACLCVLGYGSWMFYTAYGLSALPVSMMRGKRSLHDELHEIDEELSLNQRQAQRVREKYADELGSGHRSGRRGHRDEARLGLLEDRVSSAARRRRRLVDQHDSCWRRLMKVLAPFRVLFGVAFLLLTLFIVLSLAATQIDKIAHSVCGSRCGFVLKEPKLFNPFNTVLLLSAKYFPLDYILLSLVALYICVCTLEGITRIGIRFLWVKMFPVRRGRSPPNGLLVTGFIMMITLLTLNVQMLTLAPQYATFGTEHWRRPKNGTDGIGGGNHNGTAGNDTLAAFAALPVHSSSGQQLLSSSPSTWQTFAATAAAGNGTASYDVVSCSLEAPPNSTCTMTVLAENVNRLSLGLSGFGSLFFYLSWAFLFFWLLGLVFALFKAKDRNVDDDEDAI